MNKRFLPFTILSAFLLVASLSNAQTTENAKKATVNSNAAQETINDAVGTTTNSAKNTSTKAIVAEAPKEMKLNPTVQREHVILNATAVAPKLVENKSEGFTTNKNSSVIRQIEALKPISEKIEQEENKVYGSSRTNYNTLKDQLKADYVAYIATLEKQSNLEKSTEFKKAIQQEITDVKIRLASL